MKCAWSTVGPYLGGVHLEVAPFAYKECNMLTVQGLFFVGGKGLQFQHPHDSI